MTRKEYLSITESKPMIRIVYETAYSKGEINVKKTLYLKKLKAFSRALKDAIITSMEEYNYEDILY